MMSPQNNPLDGRGQSDSGQQCRLSAKANGKIAPAPATDEGIFRMPISMLANGMVPLGSVVVGGWMLRAPVDEAFCEAAACLCWIFSTSLRFIIPSRSAVPHRHLERRGHARWYWRGVLSSWFVRTPFRFRLHSIDKDHERVARPLAPTIPRQPQWRYPACTGNAAAVAA